MAETFVPYDEFRALRDLAAKKLAFNMRAMARAITEGDHRAQEQIMQQMSKTIAHSMADADMLGRASLMQDVGVPVRRPAKMRATLREVYFHHSPKIVRMADGKLTARIGHEMQELAAEDLVPTQRRVSMAMSDYSKSYSDIIFNYNLTLAFQAGRIRQSLAPDSGVLAYRYFTAHDERVRPNHAAMEGFTARPDDPVWDQLAPPLGFNCRCRLQAVTEDLPQIRNLPYRRRAPAGAFSDLGFNRSRPDKMIYGS